jgi:hypothetical protein
MLRSHGTIREQHVLLHSQGHGDGRGAIAQWLEEDHDARRQGLLCRLITAHSQGG